MKCAWQSFINILPVWMRERVDKLGKSSLQELRLRVNAPPELVTTNENLYLERFVSGEDLSFCVNIATRYSPWTASTVTDGFITAQGGHRIGICGSSIMKDGVFAGIQNVTSLCIRVARDFPGIANAALKYTGSVLIIGPPGSGKTTLLRDLVRLRSENTELPVVVIDERQEIFPQVHRQFAFTVGRRTDILTGCPKPHGVEMALRNLGPGTIVVDEITAAEDCKSLVHAGWCGVKLMATAHAGSVRDLCSRPVYRPIVESELFDTILVMDRRKNWTAERFPTCQ